jgi:hypothetical protein
MTSAELLSRQLLQTGVLLIVSGVVAMTLRRHLVANLIGVQLAILGVVLLVCRQSALQNTGPAVVILLASAALAPLALAAFAWWRAVYGRASHRALQDSDGLPNG